MESFKMLVLCTLLFYFIPNFNTLETIAPGQSVQNNETLVSPGGTFEAGFLSFGDPNNQYLGIWYKGLSPRTAVWVANRDAPVKNSSGVLNVTNGGNLVILDGTDFEVWSSNTSVTANKKPVVQLLDNGNLVVMEESNPKNILWQSFDHPGDTLLPGMRLRSNLVSGNHTSLISWRDTKDPATGLYSYYIDTHGFPQVVITKEGVLFFRAGSWNGIILSGIPSETLYNYFNFSFVLTDQEVSYGYELLNQSIISRYMLNPRGQVNRFMLSDQTKAWQLFLAGPADTCDNYNLCGANSNCNVDKFPSCDCLQGFIPKSQEKWSFQIWSDGCIRRVNLACNNSDRFVKYTGMKLPDTSTSWFNKSLNLEACKNLCLKNCSCAAYANLDIREGGSGCLLWFNNLVDIRKLTTGGQDLYIRVAATELDNNNGSKKKLAGILVGCILFIVVMIVIGVAMLRRKKFKKSGKNEITNWKNCTDNDNKEDIDIPIFDLPTIATATCNFSVNNKLGEGGFGPVYKGILPNGKEIAVKRLSNNSGQGPQQFINEAVLIAKLQHRNLVKVLGCCIHDNERLLIYEFMPNRSLDCFIFDETRRSLLHWAQRFHIIYGIARGLLYLHEDSRLRIIHRDLKTSNILLDVNMNPKISDFGLARTFGEDEAEGKTKRIAGTYGYISPEYAARGFFSVKSDVFSFGVIVLETVCGKRNRDFFDHDDLDLLGHAWKLWGEDRPLELIDESVGDTTALDEAVRCIHIGLLCVQERPDDRPDMSAVVLMLNGEKPLPRPKEPAFYPHRFGYGSSSGNCEVQSANEMSTTLLDGR